MCSSIWDGISDKSVAIVGITLILHVAESPLIVVAVIVASPIETAVTRPFSLTFAILVASLSQNTNLLVVVSGKMEAVSCTVSFALNMAEFLSSEIKAGEVEITVTMQFAVFPLVVVALIDVCPKECAVISPSISTVATVSSEELHFIVLSVVFTGVNETLSLDFSETFKLISVGYSEIEVASIGIALTVAVAFTPEDDVAVITVSPADRAVTLPFSSTMATDSSSDFQRMVLSLAVSGNTVASIFFDSDI